ncbi:hypothetical protein B0H12DRAFT_1132508 [Mycena haematopus]|nr:hypothetical protein B0H12DRAFT_1132508 [Mycena haematopus]
MEGRLLETVSDLDAPAGGCSEAGAGISRSRFHAERLSRASIRSLPDVKHVRLQPAKCMLIEAEPWLNGKPCSDLRVERVNAEWQEHADVPGSGSVEC